MEPKDLKMFFKSEQDEKMSTAQCRQIIRSLAADGGVGERLTRAEFSRLLEQDNFSVRNPAHREPWHTDQKSLVKYYVATKGTPIKSPCVDPDPKVLLPIYQDLLEKVRCFELKLCWHHDTVWVMVVPATGRNLVPGVPFDDLLGLFRVHQNSSPKRYPLILNLDCRRLKQNQINLVEYLLHSVLDDIVYQPTDVKHQLFPTLKSLFGKVLVFVVKSAAGWDLSQAMIYDRRDIALGKNRRLTADKKWFGLTELRTELDRNEFPHLQMAVAIRKTRLNRLMMATDNEEHWTSITHRLFTSIIHHDDNGDDEDNEKTNQMKAKRKEPMAIVSDLMRWGVHTIPVEDPCGKALFQLNGGCGYVLKPAALRKGKPYCIGLSEDKPGPGEPTSGPIRFMLRILLAKNLPRLGPPTDENVVVQIRIIGHPKDCDRYQTKRGCISGRRVVCWVEQIRPALRLPNFVFVHFEIKNGQQEILAQNVLPFKLLAKGNRFMELYDRNWNPLPNKARLYVHIDHRKIADCWSPDPREPINLDMDSVSQNGHSNEPQNCESD